MIDNYSWPWILYFNVPCILVIGTVTHFALRLPVHQQIGMQPPGLLGQALILQKGIMAGQARASQGEGLDVEPVY